MVVSGSQVSCRTGPWWERGAAGVPGRCPGARPSGAVTLDPGPPAAGGGARRPRSGLPSTSTRPCTAASAATQKSPTTWPAADVIRELIRGSCGRDTGNLSARGSRPRSLRRQEALARSDASSKKSDLTRRAPAGPRPFLLAASHARHDSARYFPRGENSPTGFGFLSGLADLLAGHHPVPGQAPVAIRSSDSPHPPHTPSSGTSAVTA